METNRCDIAHDAIYECHIINRFGLVYGEMKRPEDEKGVDKKRPVKAPLPVSVLQRFL